MVGTNYTRYEKNNKKPKQQQQQQQQKKKQKQKNKKKNKKKTTKQNKMRLQDTTKLVSSSLWRSRLGRSWLKN